LTPALAKAVRSAGLPFLPGVASAREILCAMESGVFELKSFPAHGRGGVTWITSMSGVSPPATLCPTGGLAPAHSPEYLALPNCGTVGGSWVTPAQSIKTGDWRAITDLARRAAGMTGA